MGGVEGNEGRKEEEGTPKVGSHTMSKTLKIAVVAEFIWFAGASAHAFARAANTLALPVKLQFRGLKS